MSPARSSGSAKVTRRGRIVPVAEHAGGAGEEDQLLRPERDRQRFGDGVGVDVVDLAVLVAGEAGHHGHEPRLHQRAEDPGIHPVDVAHVAVVHLHGLAPVVHDLHRRPPVRGDQIGVHAAQPHRLHPVRRGAPRAGRR